MHARFPAWKPTIRKRAQDFLVLLRNNSWRMAARNLFRNRSSFKGLNWNLASPRLGSARESRFKVQSPFSTGVTVEFHRVHSAGKIISSRELLIFSNRAPPSCSAIHMRKTVYNVQSTRLAKPAKYIFCTISMFFHATHVIITRF